VRHIQNKILRNQGKLKTCERVGIFQTFKRAFMKKKILSLFIIVLAVGFSAFTTIQHHAKSTDNAFWYKVDPVSKEVIAEYGFVSRQSAESSSSCSGQGDLCDEGYSGDLYNVGDEATQATNLIIQHN
jgi:hypothetical protein